MVSVSYGALQVTYNQDSGRTMNRWLPSEGVLEIDNGIRIAIAQDFGTYYRQFINKYFLFRSALPAHGVHVTIWHPGHRGVPDPEKCRFLKKFYRGRKIKFEYDPEIRIGGQTKNFMNFFMKVRSPDGEDICKYLEIDSHLFFHITVCNTKGGARHYCDATVTSKK